MDGAAGRILPGIIKPNVFEGPRYAIAAAPPGIGPGVESMTHSRISRLCLGVSAAALLGAHGALAQAQPAPAAPLPETAATPDQGTVQAVVVTGSRLQTGFQAPTPVTVLGAAQMQQQAPTTVFDIVKDIPSFRNTAGPTLTSFGVASANEVLLDLRGLGSTRTLNLVDGHRPTPIQSTGVWDTNLIPTVLIDRTEVVTGGASAAYGSDAVAGVVNFVLKDHLDGLSGSAQYGISQAGDGVEEAASLAWGASLDGGKGRFLVGGEYNRAQGIGSMYERPWGRLEPGLVTLPATRAAGLPANIAANNVEVDSFLRGGIVTSGPLKGTTFDVNGNPFPFQYGPIVGSPTMVGTTNYGENQYASTPIRSPYDRASILAKFDYDISPDVQFYSSLDWGILNAHSTTGRNPNPGNFVISRDNAYLPPATLAAMVANNLQTIVVGRQDVEYPPSQSGNRDYTLNGVIGFKGTVFNNWKWDIALDSGRSQFDAVLLNDARMGDLYGASYAVKNAQGQIVCGPAATNPYFNAQNATAKANLLAQFEPGCVPFDIFGQNAGSQASVNYFLTTGWQTNYIRQDDVSFNLTGDPITLPAGPVSLAVGVEARRNSVDANSCAICQQGGLVIFNFGTYSGKLNVKEGYAELGVPVLKDEPFFKSLAFNGAIRRTDYSVSGAVTTWKAGLTWDVSDWLRLRSTRSRDIRAPNIDELFDPGTDGNGAVINPLNGVAGFAHSRTVGNPNLTPEIADTFTAGLALQPTWSWLSGFRASFDYYNIIINNVIT